MWVLAGYELREACLEPLPFESNIQERPADMLQMLGLSSHASLQARLQALHCIYFVQRMGLLGVVICCKLA